MSESLHDHVHHADSREPPASQDPRVLADTLHQLYGQSPSALILSVVVAALWVALMWGVAEAGSLHGWIAAIVIATLGRVGLFIAYYRREPDDVEVLSWERPFSISLMPPTRVPIR